MGGEIEVSIEVVRPSPKLIITGGGRIAAKVAELGQRVGFSVTVVDPFAKEGEFPEGAKIVAKPVEQGMRELEITPQTFIAIITRHKYDEPALKAALDSGASYIGMMGSRDRVKSVFETLRKEGIREEKFLRVHAPIGLDIGAETPDEIAVSIIAEIIKGRRRPEASGKSLKISA